MNIDTMGALLNGITDIVIEQLMGSKLFRLTSPKLLSHTLVSLN
jgi:hypothetical protein